MTPDDVPNPLADVDLDAWQPPEAGMDQVEAIVQRHAGTRTDVAAAIEVTPLPPTRAQRVRWLAAGILIGAAAAALIAVALWPSSLDRPTDPPVVAPGPEPTPGPSLPGGTVNPRDVANETRFTDLVAAIRDRDFSAAARLFREIDTDSPVHARAKAVHDPLRDEFIAGEVARAQRLAKDHDCKTIDLRAEQVERLWKEAGDAVRAVPCTDEPVEFDFDPSTCDANALVAEARAAGAANDWKQVLELAERSNQCKGNRAARQLALLAACKSKNRRAALKYRDEFRANAGMRQTCQDVVDMDEPKADPPPSSGGDLGGNPYPPTSCDADALVAESRTFAQQNQWSQALQKAEASNRCKSNKAARQLALLAACKIGDKSKAQKYWKEFEANAGMRQTCISTIGE